MALESTERIALMAIHPHFADAILNGSKKVEFRKRRLAPDVRVVLLYATAPIKSIVGAFEVESTHESTPVEIWRRFGQVGTIEQAAFNSYYAKSASAVAFSFRAIWRFKGPLLLSQLHESLAVPQSFVYLDLSILSTIAHWESAPHLEVRSQLAQLSASQHGNKGRRELSTQV